VRGSAVRATFVVPLMLVAACRSPTPAGLGSRCDPEPCRGFLSCVDGVCQEARDAALERKDAPPRDLTGEEPIVDAPADAMAARDAGCDACAPSNAWTPAALPGLSVWLDAASGVALDGDGLVSQWADRSEHGNHAVQPVTASRPRFSSDGANGHPLIVFAPESGNGAGPYLSILDAESLPRDGRDFTAWVVARSTNRTEGVLLSKGFRQSPVPGWGIGVTGREAGVTPGGELFFGPVLGWGMLLSLSARYTSGALFLVTGRVLPAGSGSVVQMRVDGHLNQMVEGSLGASMGSNLLLGAGPRDMKDQSSPLTGGIAEVVIARGPISDNDFYQAERYLFMKYGFR
jgi:hypothetical protein